MASNEIKLRLANAIGEVDAAAWDACANPRRPMAATPPSTPVRAAAGAERRRRRESPWCLNYPHESQL
jgi:hypothetical protein